MPPTTERETVYEVADWLQNAAERLSIPGFRATYFRTDGDWLHYAVQLENTDPFERANILLKLEDEEVRR